MAQLLTGDDDSAILTVIDDRDWVPGPGFDISKTNDNAGTQLRNSHFAKRTIRRNKMGRRKASVVSSSILGQYIMCLCTQRSVTMSARSQEEGGVTASASPASTKVHSRRSSSKCRLMKCCHRSSAI
mmetsp:Transcript_23638/g.69954  ORF Transcript_23638/g.69954 Transcript_23638/m.69954 type:complete len:127 (+) Transcript_23638:426-806(+)